MKQLFCSLAAMALLACGASPCRADLSSGGPPPSTGGTGTFGADPQFFFTFAGDGVTASGLLNAFSNGDGTFTASKGTGTSSLAGTLTLIANPSAPSVYTSPSGYFYYDNQLLPGQDPLILNGGLLFTVGSLEVNIYSNGRDSYTYYDNTGFNVNGTFTLIDPIQTPEPSTMVIAAVGGLALAGYAFRRRKA